MDRRHGVSAPTGIQQLNSENEAARFDEALAGYFQNDNSDTPETCLKHLKRLLRDSAAPVQSHCIKKLHLTVLCQLQRGSRPPTVFSRAVALCDEIFKRSVVFRALITNQTASFFDQLLVAAGEDPSANVSRALRARTQGSPQVTEVLALIETWKQDFGDKYPSLVAGHAVLMQRGYAFPHRRERRQEQRQREVDTRRHRERVSEAKKQQRDKEMAQFVPEMEQVLVEMNRVFEILVPTLDAFDVRDGSDEEEEKSALPGPADDNDDVEWESVETKDNAASSILQGEASDSDDDGNNMDINDIVQAYGLGSSSYQLTIEVSKQVCEESSDNDALFRSLADGALRMRKRFLPLLDDWEQHSRLTGSSSSSSATIQVQREVLLQIGDLRDRMTRALLKWDDLVQGAKKPNKNKSARPAVVSLPLDAYEPPTKRRRRTSNIK
ncbi:hypothetical protein PHYSODRAFT_504986 [Phytophthora sojae]|uniref:VHS domain-containing protein n=1 Tax=Phytophthora sojae (strain P6497) TaxID=1094619 RepID=G4ZKW3_PHYSP|nr:hypothetical protein PHYSODRAFT_504986 [Phytophthora sojae]EGZ14881.1 hypothetical protein PHYSODRAFT_504986 [Phytophthora sojae]|eukprot:XP_009528630.1 hypothetical protein PHYSODRAFT_504986 [Phytophthora sojae]